MDLFFLDKLIFNFVVKLFTDSFLQLEVATIGLIIVQIFFPDKDKKKGEQTK